MRTYLIFILFAISNTIYSQTSPHENFQGKWIKGKTGYEIRENCIVVLSKERNWKSSNKEHQIFYFIGEPYISNEDTFKCWIANTFIQSTVHTDRPESKEPMKEYKVIELKLKKDGKLVLNYTTSQFALLSQLVDNNVPEVIKEDFDDHGFMEYRFKLEKLREQ
ncbi:hypothetical protein [Flavobacterium caeni]|nr:hypothetical protein [Flavobacterium caeni]